jgi:glycosyltransferase involved in cell wall biosynthesis
MKICVCGTQFPFVRGGAELHHENLVGALRRAGHQADLVRLPSAWDRARIFDAALAWRLVPIDADLVIATNFPSYFVRHPRKHVWLFHQHRAAYDAAESPWSDFDLDPEALEAQRLLVEWDNVALEEAARRFTTSREVARRLEHFNGITGEPLYHPPPLHEQLHEGPYGDYVFCATRLERNKRPDLLVEALPHLRTPTRVVIAGRGTLDRDLRDRARSTGSGSRLELPGFVPDDDLVELYAGALAVVYAPFEEDYGYVTLQAFLAGKPVITAHDSGGVLEWVEHGVTGLVTDGSPSAIAAAVDQLWADRGAAARMGAEGRRRAAALTWDSVVSTLVGG